MDYKFTYLVLDLILLVIWLIFFLVRKDTRKEMLLMSFFISFAGIPADIVYTRDWWKPEFLFPNFWFESYICAFFLGGLLSILYEVMFRKNIRRENPKRPARPGRLLGLCLIVAIIFYLSFFVFNLNSLIATILALGLPAIYVFYERSDLLLDGLLTAMLILFVMILTYSIVELITPGWVDQFWMWNNTPPIIFANTPLDDVVWYVFAGLFFGPLYAYWQEGRLVKKPDTSN